MVFYYWLGITQIVDGIAIALAEEIGSIGIIMGFAVNVFIVGIFVFFGIFARRGQNWSFYVGMILYVLDGLLFLMVQDWLSIGFHVFALYFIYGGLKASKQLSKKGIEL